MNNDTTIVAQSITPEAQSVKDMAIAKMASLERVREQKKAAKEMLDDLLMADPQYKEAFLEQELQSERKKQAKARMMAMGTVFAASEKVKELNQEYNELKTDVGDYLVLYADKTGQLSFIDPNTEREVRIRKTAAHKIIKPKPNKGFRPKG